MSETVTLTPRSNLNLNLAALHSVLFLKEHQWVKDGKQIGETRIEAARQYRVLSWGISVAQCLLLWTWTLLHTIPWPQFLVSAVHSTDAAVTPYIQAGVYRLEWWVDYVQIKTNRAIETGLSYLEKTVVQIDSVLAFVSPYIETSFTATLWLFNLTKSVVTTGLSLVAGSWDYLKTTLHGVQSTRHPQADPSPEKKEE